LDLGYKLEKSRPMCPPKFRINLSFKAAKLNSHFVLRRVLGLKNSLNTQNTQTRKKSNFYANESYFSRFLSVVTTMNRKRHFM